MSANFNKVSICPHNSNNMLTPYTGLNPQPLPLVNFVTRIIICLHQPLSQLHQAPRTERDEACTAPIQPAFLDQPIDDLFSALQRQTRSSTTLGRSSRS